MYDEWLIFPVIHRPKGHDGMGLCQSLNFALGSRVKLKGLQLDESKHQEAKN